MKFNILSVCLMTLLLSGCGSTVPNLAGIQKSSQFTLYEGLPHQGYERTLLEKDLATKKTVKIHGFPFYERPLTVSGDDAEALRQLCASPDSFKPYGGEKKCGGFHPDYCLQWQDGKSTYEFLICFGCYEMKIYSPKKETIVDFQSYAYERFKTILKKYRDQRPKTEDLP